jgi:hypothetical protein
VHSDCYVLRPGREQLQRFGHPRFEGNVYRELLCRCGTLFPSFLVSKEALTRIGYLDETIVSYQEWDTAIRLAKYYDFPVEHYQAFCQVAIILWCINLILK